MGHFIEIHSLNINPSARGEFHRLYIEEALPLFQRWHVDVVDCGPSKHRKTPIT